MKSTWHWRSAAGPDVQHIVAMAQRHFETEIDQVFEPDPIVYARNITQAVVNQFYNPGSELIQVAQCCQSDRVLGYVWASRGERAAWSDQEMVMVRMVHVDLDLGVRQRIRMITEMIEIWETWAQRYHIEIVCSTTMRHDQTAFLRIHSRCGYDVRGSYCYKKVNLSVDL